MPDQVFMRDCQITRGNFFIMEESNEEGSAEAVPTPPVSPAELPTLWLYEAFADERDRIGSIDTIITSILSEVNPQHDYREYPEPCGLEWVSLIKEMNKENCPIPIYKAYARIVTAKEVPLARKIANFVSVFNYILTRTPQTYHWPMVEPESRLPHGLYSVVSQLINLVQQPELPNLLQLVPHQDCPVLTPDAEEAHPSDVRKAKQFVRFSSDRKIKAHQFRYKIFYQDPWERHPNQRFADSKFFDKEQIHLFTKSTERIRDAIACWAQQCGVAPQTIDILRACRSLDPNWQSRRPFYGLTSFDRPTEEAMEAIEAYDWEIRHIILLVPDQYKPDEWLKPRRPDMNSYSDDRMQNFWCKHQDDKDPRNRNHKYKKLTFDPNDRSYAMSTIVTNGIQIASKDDKIRNPRSRLTIKEERGIPLPLPEGCEYTRSEQSDTAPELSPDIAVDSSVDPSPPNIEVIEVEDLPRRPDSASGERPLSTSKKHPNLSIPY